jgi:hypothetical protein
VSIQTRTIYQSSNGDRWQLARDHATGCVFVVHQANLSSDGRITKIELAAFLGTGTRGPEYQEPLRLIGTWLMKWPNVDKPVLPMTAGCAR